jgi:hypothetical protein
MSNHLHLPLGWNCNSAKKLDTDGLRFTPYAFDWIGWHSYDSIMRIMDDGWQTAFNNVTLGETNITVSYLPGKNLKAFWDNDFKFLSIHDYWDGTTWDDIRAKFVAKHEKLVGDLSIATEVTLHIGHASDNSKDFAFNYYKGTDEAPGRLGIDVRDQIDYSKTLDELKAKFQEFAPNATINAVEETYEGIL